MQDFQRREMLVNLSHEPLHEDDLGKADGQVAEIAWKGVHVVEIVQLHGVGKVQRQVLQIGTSREKKNI